MADPTLISSDTTWAGWTVTQLLDETLRPFGLTNDSTTTRVVASTDEETLARDAVRLAATYLNSRFPNVWARRLYSATWVSGDHSVLLPANCKFVERVFYGGLPLDSLSLEDRTRFTQSDEQGGNWKTDSDKPRYYYISGIADADAVANGGAATGTSDWRMVLRIVNAPVTGFDTEQLVIHMIARSPDFASADDAQAVEFDPLYHDWLVNRAVEVMAGKLGSARSIHDEALAERMKVEGTIFDFLEGTGEYPSRVRWEYPRLADEKRR